MARFLNVCRFTPTAGGTTDFTFSAAVTGYNTPALAGIVNTGVYKYRAESADLSQWEIGEGAYNTSTGVLARTTVLYNSAGTGTGVGQSGAGSKINFSTVPQIAIVALKEDLISNSENNNFNSTQIAQIRTNIGMAIGHIPGEASNGNAAAGEIGELLSFSNSSSLTSGAATANMIGASQLTPGDWDLWGIVWVTAGGATFLTNFTFSISATSATHDQSVVDRFNQFRNVSGVASGNGVQDPIMVVQIGPMRKSLSANTNFYLTGSATFTNVLAASCIMRARRVR